MIRFTALSLERWRNVTQRNGEYRDLLKTKLWKSWRHCWCIERRRLFDCSIRHFLFKVFTSKVIKKLYATPPTVFVPPAPPWHCVISVASVTPCAIIYKSLVDQSIFLKILTLHLQANTHTLRNIHWNRLYNQMKSRYCHVWVNFQSVLYYFF